MDRKEEDIAREGKRIIDLAAERGLVLRLLGGVAVALLCENASHPPFRRSYMDLDFVGQSSSRRSLAEFLEACGYKPNVMFNKLQANRMYFSCGTYERHLDIFFREFSMCHRYRFSDRSFTYPYTLPPDELLLTKLQIVQLSEKDLQDTAVLFENFDITRGDTDSAFSDALTRITRDDWGFYKTTCINLDRVREYLGSLSLDVGSRTRALSNLDNLRMSIESTPKSLRWKLRAAIGERVRWYELPEDPTRDRVTVD